MGKQKIDKCNEIVFGHRSTPQATFSFWGRMEISNQKRKKKVGFCLSLSLSSLCIFVSFRLSKLFCLLSNRVFICFCFVRKAHQKPKWIWKHLHRCPRRAECCRSQSFSDLKIHLPRRRWQFGWKMEHEAIMCSDSRFQGAADIPWWCWTTSGKLRRTRPNDLNKKGMNSYNVPLQHRSHKVNITWVWISRENVAPEIKIDYRLLCLVLDL